MSTLRHLDDARWSRRVNPGRLADFRYDAARNAVEREREEREAKEAAEIAAERKSA